jgi:uncharacterized protein YjdB
VALLFTALALFGWDFTAGSARAGVTGGIYFLRCSYSSREQDKRGDNMKRKVLVKFVAALTVIGMVSAASPVFAEDTAALSVYSVSGETADSADSSTIISAESRTDDASSEETGTSESGASTGENSGADAAENTVTAVPNEAGNVSDESITGSAETADTSEESSEEKEEEENGIQEMPAVSYSAHVQQIGWQKDAVTGTSGETLAGTTGRALRIEAIRASIKGDENLGITYNTYVQGLRWTGWQNDGAAAGTTEQQRRVEAIAMKLTGSDADKYDLCYRVYVQNFGWLAWTQNGETAGTADLSRRVEAYEVVLVKKGEAAPVRSASRNAAYLTVPTVTYQTHVQRIGWGQGEVSNGALSGTTGRSFRMEAIRIHLDNTTGFSGGISYRSHVQRVGWETAWKSDGETSGTEGSSLRLEAIQIRLTGEMANYFDVYYRTHVQRFGWTGWASNGTECGSSGFGYRLEAIEIRLAAKGSGAPGSTANTFHKYASPHAAMDSKAQGYSSSTNYLLMVNLSTHRVGLYTGSRNNWQNQKYWPCANGKPSTPTVTGVYRLGSKGLYFWSGGSKCWYYSQIYGDYLFHSVIYDGSSSPVRVLDGTLGAAVSHGCVRLALENAKYIYDNVPSGTTVVIYY